MKLRAAEWEVGTVNFAVARDLVERFHYAGGGSNTATYRHGLFPKGAIFDRQCVGIAWWIPPTKSAALATFPANWQGVLSLHRLVIAPEVPKNAASFLIGQSMRLIDRKLWPCLVTYADTWQGHEGTIYKATNWHFVGMTKPERLYIINGRMVARKAGPRTFTHAEMLTKGAECLGAFAKRKFVHIAA